MFFPEGRLRVFVYGQPVDMRKSFDGLIALTKHQLYQDPTSGHLFVFINRRGNYLKSLYWDRSGYCLWAKRLELGTFVRNGNEGLSRELDWTQFKLLLEGIESSQVKQSKRYQK